MQIESALHPTGKKNRIVSLDILRGFAILGILIMNIQSFSMPGAAYLNPLAFGDLTGLNKGVWILSHVFADQKFMTLFSILFGAGIVLFAENAERKRGKSAGLHYKRNFLLLIIGLIHAHLIWYGDILVIYALCAFIIYPLRKLNPKFLFVMGILTILVHTVIYLLFDASMEHWPKSSVIETKQSWLPNETIIQEEIAAYTGNFNEQTAHRSNSAFFLETFVFLATFLWRAGGLMLCGMALYKWGVLSAQKSKAFYIRGFIISWLIGLPIIIYGILQNFQNNWIMEYSMFMGSQFNYIGSLFIGFGYLCLIMLLVKSTMFNQLKERLAATGQMALTNYLMQSLICVLIFYGFDLFGQVSRIGQAVIVLGVWMVQLAWSLPWLRNYSFGPFEWAWRSLTYKEKQPFRKAISNK